MPEIEIKPFTPDARKDLLQHFERHRRESGIGGIHFMPFAPDDPDAPTSMSIEKALLPLGIPGWQRWFYATDAASGKVIGHVDLKNEGLRAGLHRCELGIGIEAAFRGMGLGKQLMNRAIEFARGEESLAWIDLRVFSDNSKAQALYRKLGFTQVGLLKDRFRIGEDSIDDILMVLNVKHGAGQVSI